MGTPAALLRHGGHIVSALTYRSNGPSSSPGRRHRVVFLDKTLLLSASLHPGEKFNFGGEPCDGLASHPGESKNTPSHFMLQKLKIST